jgi:hypothetical protein
MMLKSVIELHGANSITQTSPSKTVEDYKSDEKARYCAGASSADYW